MKIGFLGPSGTFSEQATKFFSNDDELIPFQTIDNALNSCNLGEVEKVVVPIENSTEGTINATVDNLIFESNLYIEKQLVMPIHHNLMVNKNNKLNSFNKIYSHPQSLAQCRKFLLNNYCEVELIAINSNAEAAEIVSKSSENIAAIAPFESSKLYNLNIISRNIEDINTNVTNFILVGKIDTSKPIVGGKTTIAFSTKNKPGELYKILDIFSLWDVNMTRIFSRPVKKVAGEYVFYVDLEDSSNIQDLTDALTMVKRKTDFYKVLGSYEVNYFNDLK